MKTYRVQWSYQNNTFRGLHKTNNPGNLYQEILNEVMSIYPNFNHDDFSLYAELVEVTPHDNPPLKSD